MKISNIFGKIPTLVKKAFLLIVVPYAILFVSAQVIDPSVEPQDRYFGVTPRRVDPQNKSAIVFIHGIGGHYLTTWKYPEFNRTWFDLLSKDERFQTFNLYSIAYDSHRGGPRMESIIDRLEKNLPNLLHGYEDTYVIAHSLGGIVFQKLLLRSAQSDDFQLHTFRNSIKLVVFLATPGRSTFKANLMTFALAQNPLWGYLASPEFVSDTIHNWRKSDLLSHIEAVCASEGRKYKYIFFIVPEESARESCARQYVPTALHADHFTIAKPKDCATDPYNWVAEEITHRAHSTGSVVSLPDRPRECWPPGANEPVNRNESRIVSAEPYTVGFIGQGGRPRVWRVAEGLSPQDRLDEDSIRMEVAKKDTTKVPGLLAHFSPKRVAAREATTQLIAESFKNRKEQSDYVEFYKALATLMRDAGLKTTSPFQGTDFTGANFAGLNLRHVDFSGSNLTRANFIGANLERATFQNACMQETKFFDAHRWAWIDGVNLSGSDLSGSELVWKETKPGGVIVGLSRASSLKATIAPIKVSPSERDELKGRGVIEFSPKSPCAVFPRKVS